MSSLLPRILMVFNNIRPVLFIAAMLIVITGACVDLTGEPPPEGTPVSPEPTPTEATPTAATATEPAPTIDATASIPPGGPRLGFVEIRHLLDNVAVDGIHLGDPAAPVRVVIYADFQCPRCRDFTVEALAGLIEDFVDPGQAYVTFLPLLGFRSLESSFSAQAALCAAEQELFWPYLEVLYNNQGPVGSGAFEPGPLKLLANEVGIQREAFDECLDSGRHLELVEHMTTEAQVDRVLTLPTFDIADRRYSGFSTYAAVSQWITAAALDSSP